MSPGSRAGPHDAITDVAGVRVGHVSIVRGEAIRTGVTAVIAAENPYTDRLRAAAHVFNGFGKSLGLDQVRELGTLESPILLTGTLNVWRVADALVDWLAERNLGLVSVNPVVCECNDGWLNDGLARAVGPDEVRAALAGATAPSIEAGNVGAGVGMTAFGWKGGIGTSSRVGDAGTVGALALVNTGAPDELRLDGAPVAVRPPASERGPAGSIVVVLATDAGLDARQLARVARRATLGLGRTGATGAHGSGDVFLAFTTHRAAPDVADEALDPLFSAAVEATEAAIACAIRRADTLVGRDGHVRHGFPREGG